MIDHSQDSARRCLKVQDWPITDQQLWSQSLRERDILDEPNAATHWSPATRHKNRRGYGRWLNFITREVPELLVLDPADRVAVDIVRQYVTVLDHQNLADLSIIGRLAELSAVVSTFAPDRDWQWLWRVVDRFRRSAKPKIHKASRLVPASDIYQFGISQMDTVVRATKQRGVFKAVGFRDGLMIALLAARPIRRSNLVSIRIDHHLLRLNNRWKLSFEAAEMKNRRPMEIALPDQLSVYLERYLNDWRPLLLRHHQSDRLWITQFGLPMSGDSAYVRITKLTKRAFGRSLNPHLFRDCVATSIAIEDPDHIEIGMTMLGHSSSKTMEKHYNHATSVEAGRQFQKTISALREEIRASKLVEC